MSADLRRARRTGPTPSGRPWAVGKTFSLREEHDRFIDDFADNYTHGNRSQALAVIIDYFKYDFAADGSMKGTVPLPEQR